MRVRTATDVAAAGRQARQLAQELGFCETGTAQIELAARELAANLVAHAGGGSLACRALVDDGRRGVRLESVDAGPGIVDPEAALADGYTTTPGSLGCGLGTVNRLMDDVAFGPGDGGHGLRLTACRYLDGAATPARATSSGIEVGVASRPHPGLQANGDAYVVENHGEQLLVAVIDGLGHGTFAERAAHKARAYAEAHWEEPFEALFRGVSRTCRGTRGVVMTALRIDAGSDRATLAGIGNVETHLEGFDGERLLIRRGILGGSAPPPVISQLRLRRPAVAVLHSDGIARGAGWQGELERCVREGAAASARRLLRERGRERDDATVLVVICGA